MWRQSPAQEIKLDSLLLINTKAKTDSNKVNILISLCDYYQSRNSDSALYFGQQAMRIAETCSFTKGKAVAGIKLGGIFYERGDTERGWNYYYQAMQWSESIANDSLIIQSTIGLCAILRRKKEYDKSRVYAAKMLKVAERSHDINWMAMAYVRFSWSYSQEGKYDSSFRYMQRVLSLRKKINDTRGVGGALAAMGIDLARQGLPLQALEYLRRGLHFREKARYRYGIILSMHQIGSVFESLGQYDSALSYYNRGLEQSMILDYKPLIASSLKKLGDYYRSTGVYEKALDFYYRSLKLREEIRIGYDIAESFETIGDIHWLLNNHEEALEYYTRSSEMIDLASEGRETRAFDKIADVFAQKKEYSIARDLYMRSLQTEEKQGNKRKVASLYHRLGNIYYNENFIDTASWYYNRSLKLAEEIGDQTQISHSLCSVGKVLFKQGKFENAIHSLEKSMSISKQIGIRTDIQDACETLSDIYKTKGDFRKAYEYHKEYSAIRDSLLNETNIRNINEMNAKYQSEKKANAIKFLQNEKSLQAVELEKKREQLRVNKLEAERMKHETVLLTQQKEIQELALHNRTNELKLEKTENVEKENEAALWKKNDELKASLLTRQQIQRDFLLVGLVCLFLIAGLILWRMQGKRREAALRAEKAEYQTRALRVEAVEREQESQKRFSQRLLESQEQERKRIAGELHDGIGQGLLIIKHRAVLALNENAAGNEHIQEILEISSESMTDVRRMSRDLRPYQLERVGLTTTLKSMLTSASESVPIEFTIDIEPVDGFLAPEQEIALYRVVQEGLNNIMKHAEAKKAKVSVRRDDGSIVLIISDDGKGFNQGIHGASKETWGLGLQGMMERITMLGGTYQIDTAPGRGMLFRASIPINRTFMEKQVEVLNIHDY